MKNNALLNVKNWLQRNFMNENEAADFIAYCKLSYALNANKQDQYAAASLTLAIDKNIEPLSLPKFKRLYDQIKDRPNDIILLDIANKYFEGTQKRYIIK